MSDDEDEANSGYLGSSSGLLQYTGSSSDSATLIYHDRDSLEVKFWKWMQYKVQQDKLFEWFSRKDFMTKGAFANQMNNLEWHCNNKETGANQQGEQLTKSQITHLLKCVAGLEKEITIKMVEDFASLEEPEEIKAVIQKHHNEIGRKKKELQRTKKERQEQADGTTAKTAATVARGQLGMLLPVLNQIFGGGTDMLSAHSTHSVANNEHAAESRKGEKYLHENLMKEVCLQINTLSRSELWPD
jgi:hypothetical protein